MGGYSVDTGWRALTQRKSAAVLAVAMVAVPGLPMFADDVLPQRQWGETALDDRVEVATIEGVSVIADPPDGWAVLDDGDSAVLIQDDATVVIHAYDLDGRDPQAVMQRLARQWRVQGVYASLDGGQTATADGVLAGGTCVAVTEGDTGSCAYVADDDVLVTVISLGTPTSPAFPATDIVSALSRGDQ